MSQLDLFNTTLADNAQALRARDCARSASLADELEALDVCQLLPVLTVIDAELARPLTDAELIELARDGQNIGAGSVQRVLRCGIWDALHRVQQMHKRGLIRPRMYSDGQPMASAYLVGPQAEMGLEVRHG